MAGEIRTIQKEEVQDRCWTTDCRRSSCRNKLEYERRKDTAMFSVGIGTRINTSNNKIGKSRIDKLLQLYNRYYFPKRNEYLPGKFFPSKIIRYGNTGRTLQEIDISGKQF